MMYAKKVKLIYIDPPYNTKNDGFKYNDRFTHSSWLTFMKNRLEAAKTLLRDDGLIFVQCDDNEQAYLKVLMDEIFERGNHLATIAWKQFHTVKNDAKNFSKNHEYCLVFSRKYPARRLIAKEECDKKENYKYDDNDGRGPYKKDSLTAKRGSRRELRTFNNGKKWQPPDGTYWRYAEERLKELDDEGKICFKGGTPYFKRHWEDVEKGRTVSTLWACRDIGYNIHGDTEIKALFDGKKVFKNPKPESYIKKIIEMTTAEGDIVLDYHLGSGTTAAVAHKMGRRYIGVEQMDYVKSVVVERLKKVVMGDKGGVSIAVDWQGGGGFVYCELAPWNEIANQMLRSCRKDKELRSVFNKIRQEYFLDYNVNIKDFTERVSKEPGFLKLSLEEQKEIFISMLDQNQLYVNLSEMADKKFRISQKDQKATKDFYKMGDVKNESA